MEIKDLAAQVAEIPAVVKETVANAEKGIKESVELQVKAAETTILEKAQSEIKVVRDENDKLKSRVDEMMAKRGTSFGAGEQKAFGDALGEALEQKAADLKGSNVVGLKTKQPFAIQLDTKAVGDLTAANFTTTATASFVPADVRPGLIMNPIETVRLRSILPNGSTGSNKITYVRENGAGEGAAAMVAPGGTKPQMDFDLVVEEADVRKIAGHIRVHEEVLEDIPYITSYLTRKGTEKVLDKEDSQILYGDGTGQNLEGLFTVATAFDFVEGYSVASANRYDVLRAAMLQARRANRSITNFLVSPLDYFLMESAKDTAGQYLFLGPNGVGLQVGGAPILPHTKITDGDFLAMDRNSAEIAFRKGIEVRFYEQDRDNAILNMVTIVVEERLALPIYEPGGIIKGTFAAALTDLGSTTV